MVISTFLSLGIVLTKIAVFAPALLSAVFRGVNRRDQLCCKGSTPAAKPRAPHSNPAPVKASITSDSAAGSRFMSAMVS